MIPAQPFMAVVNLSQQEAVMRRPRTLRRGLAGAALALAPLASAHAADLTINVPYEIRNPRPGWTAFSVFCDADTQANIDAIMRGGMGGLLAIGRTERIPLVGPTTGTARVGVNLQIRSRSISEAEAYRCTIAIFGEGGALVPDDQIDQPASTRRVTGRIPR